MTRCVICGHSPGSGRPVCLVCGGVCLRTEPWQELCGPRYQTPLIRSRTPWLKGTWLKYEGAHPSGSFKERIMHTLVSEAVGRGSHAAVVASSGNAAVAAAAQAARFGIPLLVVVPERVPRAIERMVEHRGAYILRHGEGPAAAHIAAKRIASELNLPNLSSTFAESGCEWACRGIGHEIADQLEDELTRLSTVAAAVSVGPVLLGTGNGLAERGIDVRLLAGQAAGCSPIAQSFNRGEVAVKPWDKEVDTDATSISDRLTGYAEEATSFLHAVRKNSGAVFAFPDHELRQVRADLAFYDGLDVELSSCAGPAAVRAAEAAGESAVAVLTGNGLRETLGAQLGSIPISPASTQPLEAFVNEVHEKTIDPNEVKKWLQQSI